MHRKAAIVSVEANLAYVEDYLPEDEPLLAARRNGESIHHKDVLDALETLVLGPARALVMSIEERTRVAYHEGGHAILGLLMPGADPVNRVTIVPHGMALGVTYQRPEDDRHSYSEQYLHARIVGAMGGRSAEEVVFDAHTTGSENNIRCYVTRRKVSAGTRSDGGRDCRDGFLGLARTCDKLGIAVWDYLGSRLKVAGKTLVQPLDRYVRGRFRPA